MRLEHPNASAEAALTMLAQLSPAQSGEALHGLLALAVINWPVSRYLSPVSAVI